jgi:hypothetical protein
MADEEYKFDLTNPVDVELSKVKDSYFQKSEAYRSAFERKNDLAPTSSPSDLNQNRPADPIDVQHAELRAKYAAEQHGQAPAPATEEQQQESAPPMSRDAAIAEMSQILGMDPASEEFENTMADLQGWFAEKSSHPNYKQLEALAEKVLGREEAVQAAIREARARSRR